jgi:hypothetical protein
VKKLISVVIFISQLFFSIALFAQEDIRDVKPPQGLPFPWLVIITFVLIFLIAAILWILFGEDKKRNIPVPDQKPLSPWEAAMLKLKDLQEKDLLKKGLFHDFYFELSDILRHYIEARFNIDAPERTTEEFLLYMKEINVLSAAQKNTLKNFLIECDKVKFAKFAPTIDNGNWAFGIAKTFVEETAVKPQTEGFNAV